MIIKKGIFFGLVFSLFLMGCSPREGLAPIGESKWQPFSLHQKNYIVRRGDTLYAIAFRYDKDYRQLAHANRLRSPYALRIGQNISLQTYTVGYPKKISKTRRYEPQRKYSSLHAPKRSYSDPKLPNSHWRWPAKGRIASSFVPYQGKKGINIAGKRGEKVYAATDGTVAYAGNGLSGYGNLIIIKHTNEYLTAYGNNAKNLVREGQRVKAGQLIADMGIIDRQYWGVHFEIRKRGIPVNPLNYLQKG